MRSLFAAAVMMFLATLLGAFGAHALRAGLEEANHVSTWQTAVDYHFVHALAVLAISIFQLVHDTAGNSVLLRWCVRAWLLGICAFSGSLYCLALGGPGWLGPVTPLGGLLFLAGWALLAIAAVRMSRKPL